MAATYTAIGQGVAWAAAAKNMMNIWNGAGSGRIVRVYRIWLINAQISSVTSASMIVWDIRRVTARTTGGTAITPVKHDTNSENLPAGIIAEYNATTLTTSDILRRGVFSADEPAAATAIVNDDLWTLIPLTLIWDPGYGSAAGTEPFVCREAYGIVLTEVSGTAVGIVDIVMEFTTAAS